MKKISLSIIAVAALLVAVTFTGCTREESKNDNGPATLVLKIQQGETRAATTPVSSVTSTLNDGFVFITNGSGVIVHALQIISGSGPATTGQVLLSTLTGGNGAILTVPAGAQHVYVFGNLTTVTAWTGLQPALTAANAVGRNISTLTALNVTASNLTVANGVANVPLYGDAAIEVDGSNADFKASPKVYPVASRVEIAKISGPTTDFSTLKVVDILVNYYYPSRNFLGGNGETKVTHGTDVNDYKYATNGDKYFGFLDVLYNNPNLSASGTPRLEAVAGGGNVWAYNLPAPGAGEAFPHIVLKLEVEGSSFVGKETKYLTVKSVTNASGGGAVQFEKGKIYKIADLQFVATDLAVTPEPADKTLAVKATIMEWVIVNINPSF